MYFHKAQEKPRLYGSFQDRQYSIWRNLEDIYRCDHESEVLIIPGFWGLPPLDYSKYGNHGINYGATYKDGSLDFDGTGDKIKTGIVAHGIGTGDFTFSGWINMDDYAPGSTAGPTILTNGVYAPWFGISANRAGDNENLAFYWNGWYQFDTTVSLSNFHYCVLRRSGGVIYAYLDGNQEVTTHSLSTSMNNASAKLGTSNTGDLTDGTIDEVRISKVARTADQIALFHDRPWDLYRPVSRPIYSLPTLPVAIIHFHKAQQKPQRWGNFQDVQYAIRKNSEKIYGCDPDDDVLVMPLFWGLPLLDYSGYNNHGTNHGATYKDGSLDFDGNNDYVNIADNASLDLNDDSMSFSVRIKPNFIKTADIHGFVFDKTFDNAEAYRLLFNESIDNFRFRVFTSSGAVNCDIEGGSWNINTWHHLAGSYNGSNMRIYWDGSLENTVAQTGNITTNNDPFLIGAGDDTIRFFNGTIDEVRISKVARTADQIALFHDRPWDLYRPVSRPIYSLPTLPVAIMNQFQGKNLGADLFNGSFL